MDVPIGIPLLNFNTMKYNGIRSVTLVTIFLLVKRFGSKGDRWPQYVISSSLNSVDSLVPPNLALNLKQKLMGIIIAIITR